MKSARRPIIIRRRLIALAVAILAYGAITAHAIVPIRADSAIYVSNISVAVADNAVTYDVCVVAPSEPNVVLITVRNAGTKQLQQVTTSYRKQSCGTSGSYFLQGSATIPAGSYQFQTACGLLADGTLIPCAIYNVGFVSTLSTDSGRPPTIENNCAVDFSTDHAASAQNCSLAGARGSFPGVSQSTATGTPTGTATGTPTGTATGTPTGTATGTPIATTAPISGTATPIVTPSDGATYPLSTFCSTAMRAPLGGDAFFAEGYTGGTYQEYLSLLNPGAHSTRARVTIYRADGAKRVTVAVPLRPFSRQTLNINTLAPRAGVALWVQDDSAVVVERALYSGGNGHIVAGAPRAGCQWYVAAGYVGAGFGDGLRIFNPTDTTAVVSNTAYRSDGSTRSSRQIIPSGARVNVALDDVAPVGPSSMEIDSSVPVVVESVARTALTSGPSAAMALSTTSREWYFPDGSASTGNQEYITMFNPNPYATRVRVRSIASDGAQALITLDIGPHARGVAVVHRVIHRSGLATIVEADRPIVAQEERYTAAGGLALVDGTPRSARVWGFAEGFVGQGFKEWLTVLNPGSRVATVRVSLIGRDGVARVVTMHERPHRHDYLYVNGAMPSGPVAAVLTSDQPIVAGRTMIFNGGKGLSTTTGVILQS